MGNCQIIPAGKMVPKKRKREYHQKVLAFAPFFFLQNGIKKSRKYKYKIIYKKTKKYKIAGCRLFQCGGPNGVGASPSTGRPVECVTASGTRLPDQNDRGQAVVVRTPAGGSVWVRCAAAFRCAATSRMAALHRVELLPPAPRPAQLGGGAERKNLATQPDPTWKGRNEELGIKN